MSHVIELDQFTDVLRTVMDHVLDTGHQDIVLVDEPRTCCTGYACLECKPSPRQVWLAPVTTCRDVRGKYADLKLTNSGVRADLVHQIVREALRSKAIYRPTAWERILRP